MLHKVYGSDQGGVNFPLNIQWIHVQDNSCESVMTLYVPSVTPQSLMGLVTL